MGMILCSADRERRACKIIQTRFESALRVCGKGQLKEEDSVVCVFLSDC